MIPMTVEEVAAACDGALSGVEPGAVVRAVCTDSRRVRPGDLFVGLRGERFDGDAYAAQALERGAVAAVVRRETAAVLRGSPVIAVGDGVAALGALAWAVRRRSRARVVAITGSAGKTTTKDILAALLRPLCDVVATRANLNNQVGLPQTLLEVTQETDVVIVEMAMRGPGQIRELARLALPDIAVITTIAPVHLEFVGTLEGVAAAKAELIEELHGGTAVVPGAAALLAPHLRRHDGRVVTFGTEESDVRFIAAERRGAGTHVLVDAFTQRAALDFGFTGAHYLYDAQAALAAFVELGFRLDEARVGAGRVVFSEMRGETVALRDGGLLVNDAYNANPVATQAALDHLVQLAGGREAVAVLGDMAELGPGAAAYHAAVGEHAVRLGVRIVAVGDLARHYLTGSPGERWFRTVEECLAYVREAVPPGCAVLVKASRAMRLERVAEAIVAASGGAAEGDDAEVGVGVAKDEEDGDA
ncbi:MAG TPA: UDP-N-acetylmuramoyl-tripeptide--D-alanyl-D-alanine ligase [Thermoleophilia bacterium]|nr:UDP-N-acetylmuramoyl-tripeptide--D-alanyl-D-alanine ligase [Thermoleophilia bacterium]HQG54819.1 UDP-N-acetylmuramoyl-tripeptide--D-alanyl-D-alanine ligase [Thermoleophilia bacterium]HQJ97286.1 UDP-N-acetylmuramoyl-tripeptide--D-alanyl-D-alanine ligase [Thermoleophilia bacterium]